jgi:MoxR-like ATPase
MMKDKLVALSNDLNMNFKEREEEIAGALLAIISGEHVLFIGPPGTAKSLMAREVCKCIEGGNFFYYLLTRFTTPDEIFGPLSLSSLQEDVFRRKIEGYLPTASVSFLDEIFKANSSILNSLLTILNERKFHNGSEILDVPLFAVFGASNELPEENENLEALYDRFLFRYYVRYVQDETNFRELILGRAEDFVPSVRIGVGELDLMNERAMKLNLDDVTLEAIVSLRKEFRSMGVNVSDRRWKKFVHVLRAASAALGRENVDRTMILILQHMTWNKPEEKDSIRKALIEMAVSGGVSLDKIKKDVQDLHASAILTKDYDLPVPVRCSTCEKEFHTWKEIKEHASNNSDHAYCIEGEEQKYQLTHIRTSQRQYPNLLEKFNEMGRPVKLSLTGERRELYMREL